jgi:hypothetical protein
MVLMAENNLTKKFSFEAFLVAVSDLIALKALSLLLVKYDFSSTFPIHPNPLDSTITCHRTLFNVSSSLNTTLGARVS